ncbi:MAG: tetratricopeptide repeat protein [Bacteroidales bacterium]|jgi:two-component system NtrC family sensor kinase|nr:tetratricopeptide repeat protein [Bacteroidales bacterium]
MKLRLNIILVLLSIGIFASNVHAKSSMMQKSIDDTTRIGLLNALAFEFYKQSEFDSCLHYSLKALSLSENLLSSKQAINNAEFLKQSKILKAKSLANIAMGTLKSNSNVALDTLRAALLLMKETGNKEGQADIYSAIAAVYDFNFKNEEAFKNHLLSIELYRETGNKNKLAPELTNLAILQRYLGKYGDALENLVESLKISSQINDSSTMVETLLAMGFVYLFVEKYDDALKSQNDALLIYEAMKDTLGIAIIHNDMGVANMKAGNLSEALKQHQAALEIRLKSTEYYYTFASYSYIGSIYEEWANYTEALRNYEAGLEYAALSDLKTSIVDANLECGMIHFKTAEYDKAMQHFRVALELSRKIEDHTGESKAAMNIAEIYLSTDETAKAISWLIKAEKVVPKSAFKFMAAIYERIAASYYKIGDYENAYKNQQLYSQVKDSLVIAENRVKITTLINRLDIENKQALQNEKYNKMLEIKQSELKRQKVLRNFFLFGMFIILVMAVIYFIRYTEKKKLNTKLNNLLSNLKSTQTQLIQSEKMASLGELTAGIAHEIQNPLNFVNNFSEVSVDILEELKDELENGNLAEVIAIAGDLKQNLEKIGDHGKRASSIVKGMLEHSRTSDGQRELTDINALANEFLSLAYHGLRAKDKSFNADFKTEFDNNLPKIKVIPQDISRVLLNLINNAFHACTERSRTSTERSRSAVDNKDFKPLVSVSTSKENDQFIIKVKDNGNGIHENIKDKIFQPFFTTKPTGQGTGLGLSLSYDIIKAHGGELKVETTEGLGSEFVIILPIINS